MTISVESTSPTRADAVEGSKQVRILYLYAEVMGYTIAGIRALANLGAVVHVVHWVKGRKTPYNPPQLENVVFHDRNEMSARQLDELAAGLCPDITVISGWMDNGYLAVARKLRRAKRRVVVGFDGQWYGTPRQWFAALLGAVGFFRRFYSHAWVAGPFQFEYARRLGFSKQQIVYDLYSADTDLFETAYTSSVECKRRSYPHRILYVGRLEPVKGIDTLLRAWQMLGADRLDWELHLIGHGSLAAALPAVCGVVVKEFLQPDQLAYEVATAGCLVLPSRSEPWGVVVHEFAAAGLPLLVAKTAGAATLFLIPGMNGFCFEPDDPLELARVMRKMIGLSDEEFLAMSGNSHRLSRRITPESSAGNLLSICR
jgi:glycosyltransferase involved in cell wall biosynthesis